MSVRQIGQPRPSSRTRLAHEEQKRWCPHCSDSPVQTLKQNFLLCMQFHVSRFQRPRLTTLYDKCVLYSCAMILWGKAGARGRIREWAVENWAQADRQAGYERQVLPVNLRVSSIKSLKLWSTVFSSAPVILLLSCRSDEATTVGW